MNTRRLVRPLRFLSFITVVCFSWSLVLASSIRAATDRLPLPPGHKQLLSKHQMQQIIGASTTPIGSDPGTGGGAGGNAAQSPGSAYPWEGAVNGVKTGNGNKMTSISLVSWQARGGLNVDFTLYHNSLSAFTTGDSRGSKWTYGFDTAMVTDPSTGNVKIGWGNGTIYVFSKNVDGSYTPPPGIHDKLTANGSGSITSFDLVTKSQIKYHLPYYSSPNNYLLTAVSDENGNTVTINRASNGGLLSVVDPTNRQITFGFNSTYNTSITDPLGRVFAFGYDANGNLSQVTYPTINSTSYSVVLGYDSNHNITSFKDARGNTSLSSYNSDSTIAWQQDAIGNRLSFTYNGSGTSGTGNTVITDPNGHTVTHFYTGGVISSISDAFGDIEYYTYDTSNNVTQKKDRRGYYWNYTYDANGNVLTAQDPYHTSTFTYNSHSRLLTATAPSGRNVLVTYDGSDNPTQVQEKDVSGNVKSTTTYTIGSYGLVSAKTDSNSHETLYTYDANGYLHTVTTPKGNETQWTYDALGFQTSRTDAMSRTTTYTPDAWERLVTTTYPDSSTKTFSYDPNNNLIAFANYTGNWARTYDADNRMLTESLSGTRTVSHSYDAAGQKGLLSTTTDYDGRVISYAYSARNELTSVGDSVGTATYQYDADGNKIQVNDPNGMIAQWGYDNASRLSAALDATSSGSVIAAYNYAFNTDSQISTLTEGYGPYYSFTQTSQTTYGYDPQGHLTSEVRTGQNAISQTFGYDTVGNRTSFNNGGNNVFSLDADDEPTGQTGANTFVLGYNANGDRTSESVNGNVTTFGYDYDDQLTSLTKSGTTVTYRYDPLGRQVSKQVGSTVTAFYLDGNTVLLEKQGSVETAQYLWGNGLVRCNSEYPLTDGRGNVRLTTNASQSVTSSSQPDAFGVNSVTSGTASAYAYGGAVGYREEGIAPAGLSTGYALQKVGARYYDQAFGAFLTRDTDLSQKPYAYCDGDPVNACDPTGHVATNPTTTSSTVTNSDGSITTTTVTTTTNSDGTVTTTTTVTNTKTTTTSAPGGSGGGPGPSGGTPGNGIPGSSSGSHGTGAGAPNTGTVSGTYTPGFGKTPASGGLNFTFPGGDMFGLRFGQGGEGAIFSFPFKL